MGRYRKVMDERDRESRAYLDDAGILPMNAVREVHGRVSEDSYASMIGGKMIIKRMPRRVRSHRVGERAWQSRSKELIEEAREEYHDVEKRLEWEKRYAEACALGYRGRLWDYVRSEKLRAGYASWEYCGVYHADAEELKRRRRKSPTPNPSPKGDGDCV